MRRVGFGSRTCSFEFRVTKKRVSARVSRELHATKAKENLKNLDMKAVVREAMSSKPRERVRNYPCDRFERRGCFNFGTDDQRDWALLETSGGHEDGSGEYG